MTVPYRQGSRTLFVISDRILARKYGIFLGSLSAYKVYGRIDAPYVFVELPESMGGSWNAFSTILEKTQVVTIPGAGFGPGGEGYLRLSAFAPREGIVEACERLIAALAEEKEEED